MLREIKTKHLKAQLLDFYGTTSGGNAVAVAEGSNDFTAAEGGAGLPVLTLRQPFARVPLVFGSCGSTSGPYVSQNAASTKSALSLKLNDNSGSAVEAQFQAIVYGWRSSDTNLVMPQLVTSSERRTRVFGAIINSDGTVAFGSSDISVSKTVTGTYNITFKRAFVQKPVVVCTGSNAGTTAIAARTSGQLLPAGAAITTTGGRIFTYDENGTLTDAAFNIIVMGNDGSDEHGGSRAPVKNPQRKPRIIAGQITGGATPSLAIGAEDCTVARTGAGDYTLTFLAPFRQTPPSMACARNSRVMIVSASSSTLRLRMSGGTNVAGDPTSVDFLCLGTDDPSEY